MRPSARIGMAIPRVETVCAAPRVRGAGRAERPNCSEPAALRVSVAWRGFHSIDQQMTAHSVTAVIPNRPAFTE